MTVAWKYGATCEKDAHFSDSELLELVQRQTFDISGRQHIRKRARPHRIGERTDPTTTPLRSSSGFGIMAIVVAAERAWITRRRPWRGYTRCSICWRGRPVSWSFSAFHEWTNRSRDPLQWKDDGGDLVETSFLFQGLCAHGNILTAAQ